MSGVPAIAERLLGRADGIAAELTAAIRKAEREVAEFRRFQELSRGFVETNTAICRLRPAQEESQTDQEKKRRKRSGRRSRAK